MTGEGEAAQQALESFERRSDRSGELRRSDLADIRNILRDLSRMSLAVELDSDAVYRHFITLQARFESLVAGAQAFMGELQRKIDCQSAEDAESITVKQRVIDYLQRFIGDLVIAAEDIGQAVRHIENAGIERLLQSAAERTVVDEMDPGPEKLGRPCANGVPCGIGFAIGSSRGRDAPPTPTSFVGKLANRCLPCSISLHPSMIA